ncbi:PREDICTED: POU domain, class 4, transcription factor 2-like [Ceratosolen solmsi marchali]|uniref:POU domain, class 4, transcription factor 2-like n=1 Tax=Ceratosolen solmsi marchali TaxID=326594 RepID=A0AAJ6YHJ4_9HYME|nr:PREDICTED: POU domain, class 4, transcription factor 2-like [Ceratosolen solmsi marchali]
MLSYMLPTEEKPPAGNHQGFRSSGVAIGGVGGSGGGTNTSSSSSSSGAGGGGGLAARYQSGGLARAGHPAEQHRVPRSTSGGIFARRESEIGPLPARPGSAAPLLPPSDHSPKHNGTAIRKSTLHTAKVVKDDSLYSIDSDASGAGSDRRGRMLNGPKHANLKRVSFGSSKGSMVETLVYETPVQEEPENNHFVEQNGRVPCPLSSVPDTE